MMKKVFVAVAVLMAAAVIVFGLSLVFRHDYIPLQNGFQRTIGDAQKFYRNYPEKIKLVYTNLLSMHGPVSAERGREIVEENLLVKKRLGANTYNIDDGYEYMDGGFLQRPDVRQSSLTEMLAAKNEGMAIKMVSSWGMGAPQLRDVNEIREFFRKYTDVLVEEAKLAERMKVEYFSLFEPDHVVLSQPFYVDDDTVADIVNEFKDSAVKRIREVYEGGISYQIGNADMWNFTKLNVSGLDHFGVLIGGLCDFEKFKDNVDRIFSMAESLSESSGVPWVISELWINKKYDEEGNACDLRGRRSRYFEYVFEKAREARNLKGIMIDTWNVDEPGFETSVKDTEAEKTIKSFFESWN